MRVNLQFYKLHTTEYHQHRVEILMNVLSIGLLFFYTRGCSGPRAEPCGSPIIILVIGFTSLNRLKSRRVRPERLFLPFC